MRFFFDLASNGCRRFLTRVNRLGPRYQCKHPTSMHTLCSRSLLRKGHSLFLMKKRRSCSHLWLIHAIYSTATIPANEFSASLIIHMPALFSHESSKMHQAKLLYFDACYWLPYLRASFLKPKPSIFLWVIKKRLAITQRLQQTSGLIHIESLEKTCATGVFACWKRVQERARVGRKPNQNK